MRRFLTFLLIYLTLLSPAFPTSRGAELLLLFANKIATGPIPAVSQNFLSNTSPPTWLNYSGITGNRMMYDSTGTLTWAPNNQYINSNAATSTARTITTAAGVNYYIWIQTSSGTATVVASGTNTTTFNGSAGGTFTAFTATAGTLTLTPTTNFANITQVVVAQITYESALRSGDNVVTGAAAYFGPRFDYPGGVAAGLLIEESRTNIALWNRDLTNAAWTKTNVTAALNQTGIDGTANSASTITASAGNGTVLQAITLASSQRFQSTFTKRITGTGTVNMTTDGGATWTAITVTGSWARVSIPAQTVTNPSIGFQIVTNGDAIAVDYVQNENGAFATSPIYTTTASVTRATALPHHLSPPNKMRQRGPVCHCTRIEWP